MELHEQFMDAVECSKKLMSKPDNNTLLQLYSLYKQATEGDVQGGPPENSFDFVGKAKYKAWESLKGKSHEEAMREYVYLIGTLKTESGTGKH